MPKTMPGGLVELPGATFRADVMPDVFDIRDLSYSPRLAPLPPVLDRRPDVTPVLRQEGNSCTGHALAAMINTVLSSVGDAGGVSPYMLYRMARRYDEFEGETDEGSSLRGALKGWFYHGVLPLADWPSLDAEPDLDGDAALAGRAFRRPLGAFYRVNAHRLDDMQSAVNELNAVAVSALIHTGWVQPTRVVGPGEAEMYVIERPPAAGRLGGHAFVIVGYNDTGFLVQNSWGTEWGSGGFATLPYDDWLESAYDAWVARPGVPTLARTRDRSKTVEATSGALAQGPGPDLARLSRHVVNLGNGGTLSTTGRFTSSPPQLERIMQRMAEYHRFWSDGTPSGRRVRRVVLYAHGGLVSERSGLSTAQAQVNWWLNNQVYPISFAWQSGPAETLVDHLTDLLREKLPFGGIGFDLIEQADRFVEKFARANLRWMWAEMKENAAAASRALPPDLGWPVRGGTGAGDLPGASLLVRHLRRYAEELGDDELEVHLVGHSAGSIFTANLLPRLKEEGVRVASVSWLAPAIRLDEFERLVLPHLTSGQVGRLVSFGLSESQELNDVVGTGSLSIYQKSLLMLVSHALEVTQDTRAREVPLFGMECFMGSTVGGATLAELTARIRAEFVFSPSQSPSTSRSGATSHGGFDNDTATMTSVMTRILGLHEPLDRTRFEPHAPLLQVGPPAVPVAASAESPAAPSRTADVDSAGSVPVTLMAAAQPDGVEVPATNGRLPEERLAPESGSPVMDTLTRNGWRNPSRGEAPLAGV